jgi:elongation factor Ts
MAAITASMVAELRAKTDAPMMECKKALTEAAGDMAKAEEILRVKLGSKAGKAASRVTAEGVVAAFVEGSTGALVEVNCETDFVSKNDSFLAFSKAVAELVAKHNPSDVAAVATLSYSQDGFGPTVEDVRKGLIGKIGENMTVRRFKRYAGGGKLASYLHGTRIGVMVEFDGDEVAAKDVAMHVAAMKPVARSSADVPADLVDKERSIAQQKAAESGKPADIVAKMVEGSVQKFLKEVSRCSKRPTPRSRASRSTWWERASKSVWTTLLPKWLPRWPPQRAPDAIHQGSEGTPPSGELDFQADQRPGHRSPANARVQAYPPQTVW